MVDDHLKKILLDISQLGKKFAVLLIQLPPSLAFDKSTAVRFFKAVYNNCGAAVVLEPRHLSLTSLESLKILTHFNISMVAADPEICKVPTDFTQQVIYARLHGSPKIYRSTYSTKDLNHRIAFLRKNSCKGKTKLYG